MRDRDRHGRSGRPFRVARRFSIPAALVIWFLATQVSTVAAHGSESHGFLSRWHGIGIAVVGALIVGGAVVARRREKLSPAYALYTVLGGLAVAVLGIALFDGLSADPTYSAETMPFPRSWYTPMAVFTGLGMAVGSLVIGWIRWPTRPRYMFLGVLLSLWILYPELLPEPQRYTNPAGYLIVLSTPVLIGYILWKDARGMLSLVRTDPIVRRFGIGVGLLSAIMFTMLTGYMSFFPEEGAPTETVTAVLPVVYQLVSWPTVELWFPDIPFFIALSPGMIILNGMIATLVGLNAAVVAREWQMAQLTSNTGRAAGTATIAGSCTCGCCGPLVGKFIALGAGPSVAAPLYWVFVDSSSPFILMLIVASVLLFIGVLVRATRGLEQSPEPACTVTGD